MTCDHFLEIDRSRADAGPQAAVAVPRGHASKPLRDPLPTRFRPTEIRPAEMPSLRNGLALKAWPRGRGSFS